MKERWPGVEIAAIDHVLLSYADQHVIERDEFGCRFGFDLFQVVAEAGFRGAPVGDGVVRGFAGDLVFGFVPIEINGRIALDVESFLIGFAEAWIEDKLRYAARIADSLGLEERHVVGDAVLGLAGGEGLEEHCPAIFQSIKNGAVELGRVGHGDLRDEGRTVAGEEGFRDGLLLSVLALRGCAEGVHVAAAKHGRGVRVLAAGVRIDLRIEHEDLDVGPVLQDDLGDVLIADVAHAAVAADGPDLGQLDNFLIGHERVSEVAEVVILSQSSMTIRSSRVRRMSARRSGMTERRA